MEDLKELKRLLGEHSAKDEKTMSELHYDIRSMKENHLAHIERSMLGLESSFEKYGASLHLLHGKLDQNSIETVKNTENISWLKWGFMAFGGCVIAATVTLIFK